MRATLHFRRLSGSDPRVEVFSNDEVGWVIFDPTDLEDYLKNNVDAESHYLSPEDAVMEDDDSDEEPEDDEDPFIGPDDSDWPLRGW